MTHFQQFYLGVAPTNYESSLEPEHEQEWLNSGVDPAIIQANVKTIYDTAIDPYGHEAAYPIAEFLNWNVTRFGHQARETMRGWICQGLDPATGERMEWGCCKLDIPRLDAENKALKYEHPKGEPTRAFFLEVPNQTHLWLETLANPDIPIIIVEGAKKAGCLLSLGYVAIALPGIFNGYRKQTQQLIPELSQFAIPGRQIYICFDHDTKSKTIQNVNIAISRLGRQFINANCDVKVISLPGPEKGVDDFVVARGQYAFDDLYKSAVALEFWQSSKLWTLNYNPDLLLNQQYLGSLPFPKAGLVCIKSPKGTGKTSSLEPLVHDATREGRRVLVITHRIQLGRAICKMLGLDWIEQVRDKLQTATCDLSLGYGLCIDSLHDCSQARFNPQDWKGALIVLDEVEQVIWHALNSETCHKHRVKILDTFKELVQVVLSTGGLIVAQDADLSDLSVDYLKALAQMPVKPWIVKNEWQQEMEFETIFYDTPNPAPLVAFMEKVIETGPVFVTLDSQKVNSKWSSTNLETLLRSKFPDKPILRIDSETVSNPEHPAYRIVERINEVIINYEIVIATPTLGTGVSIDVQGYFVAVFGIFLGVTSDYEVRQGLMRVRGQVLYFIWSALFGLGKIGNGSCNYADVALSTTKAVKYNIGLLKDVDFDLEKQTDPITLRTWAKMAARVNISMWNYREELRKGLTLEGHKVRVLTGSPEKNDFRMRPSPPTYNLLDIQTTEYAAGSLSNSLFQGLIFNGHTRFTNFSLCTMQLGHVRYELTGGLLNQVYLNTNNKKVGASSSISSILRFFGSSSSGMESSSPTIHPGANHYRYSTILPQRQIKQNCFFLPVAKYNSFELSLGTNEENCNRSFEYLELNTDKAAAEKINCEMTAVREANKQAEAIAVAESPDIAPSEYEKLKYKRAKTSQERYTERKHELQKRYFMPVTPELKLKDDEGWYSQLRLHYYLTHDPEFVKLRDLREWQGHLDRGEGKVALQDVRLLTAQVEALRELGILQLLDPNRKVRSTDLDVQRLAVFALQCSSDIKTLFNLTISNKMAPIQIVQTLLGKLGVKLTCISRDQTADGRRGGLRVYHYLEPTDGRQAIFQEWKRRDLDLGEGFAAVLTKKGQSSTRLDKVTL